MKTNVNGRETLFPISTENMGGSETTVNENGCEIYRHAKMKLDGNRVVYQNHNSFVIQYKSCCNPMHVLLQLHGIG
jgi:hypothetical protein